MSRLQPNSREEAFGYQIEDWARSLRASGTLAHKSDSARRSFQSQLEMIETMFRAYRLAAGPPTDDFNRLSLAVAAWAEKTILESTDDARITHLVEEVEELRAEPHSAEEMADVLLILVHHAHRHGVDLLSAAWGKFDAVQGCEWEAPDGRGVVRRKK